MPAPATPPINAELIEIFSSVQGEGVWAGCRQVFVRFAECNLACAYCDTPFQPVPKCRIEQRPGSGRFRWLDNPVSLNLVTDLLVDWQTAHPGMHHSVSLTGGEPLLHADQLEIWLPRLSAVLPVHLETNGTLPKALERVVSSVKWVSMDVKLQSTSGQETPWEEHRQFVSTAGAALCQVKVVVDDQTPVDEIDAVARLLAETAPGVPLVLQPRTGKEGLCVVRSENLLMLQAAASRHHDDVRVIPQMHVYLKLP